MLNNKKKLEYHQKKSKGSSQRLFDTTLDIVMRYKSKLKSTEGLIEETEDFIKEYTKFKHKHRSYDEEKWQMFDEIEKALREHFDANVYFLDSLPTIKTNENICETDETKN